MDKLIAQIDGYLGWAKTGTTRISKSLSKNDKGLMDAVNIVLALVLIVVVGVIGIYIAQATITATNLNPNMLSQTDWTNLSANRNITVMQNNFLGAGQTGSSFIVILIISFIGGIAISYMFGMLGKTRRG